MTEYSLTLKFKSKDDLAKVRKANQDILLVREVAVQSADDNGGERAYRVAWRLFQPEMTGTLTWNDSYTVYAAEIDPAVAAGDDGSQRHPWGVYPLSPTSATPGSSYAFKYGTFHSGPATANGVPSGSFKLENAAQSRDPVAFGLGQEVQAKGFDPAPLPDPQPEPAVFPIVVQKLPAGQRATFKPTPTAYVALSKKATTAHVLSALPDDALTLPFGADTTSLTATYDPNSGTFKLDQDNAANTSGSGDTGDTGKAGDAPAPAPAGASGPADGAPKTPGRFGSQPDGGPDTDRGDAARAVRPARSPDVPATPHGEAPAGPGPTRADPPVSPDGPGHPQPASDRSNPKRMEADMNADSTEGNQSPTAGFDRMIARALVTSGVISNLASAAKSIDTMVRGRYPQMRTEVRVSTDRRTTEIHVNEKKKDKDNGDKVQQISDAEKPFVSDLDTAKRNFIQSSIMSGLGEAGVEPNAFRIEYFD